MTAIRVNNPEAFKQPIIADFFEKAAKACKLADPRGVVTDLAGLVANPKVGCWLSVDEKGPTAVIAVMLPQNSFMEVPQVMLIYSENREGIKDTVEQGLEFCKENGYNRAWGLNRSGSPDEALQKLFGYVGFAKTVGNLMEYEF